MQKTYTDEQRAAAQRPRSVRGVVFADPGAAAADDYANMRKQRESPHTGCRPLSI